MSRRGGSSGPGTRGVTGIQVDGNMYAQGRYEFQWPRFKVIYLLNA
jgi:hypothetical protein